jgi:hypothetical protein
MINSRRIETRTYDTSKTVVTYEMGAAQHVTTRRVAASALNSTRRASSA